MSQPVHYKETLKSALLQRQEVDGQYSLRQFAKDIGVSPSLLSEVLNDKHGLSRNKALLICRNLGLSQTECKIFCDSVEAEHARNSLVKNAAKERLANHLSKSQVQLLEEDQFRLVADWYHMAILSMVTTKGFRNDTTWISSKLGITRQQTDIALNRLKRVGLLREKSGKWSVVHGDTDTSTDIPSLAIKKFQDQILHKGRLALENQSVERRDVGSMVMAINKEDIPAAKEDLRAFRDKFCKKYEKGDGDSVYCLNTLLFSLTQD